MNSDFSKACIEGRVEQAQTIYVSNPSIKKYLKEIAYGVCKNGHISIVKWLIEIIGCNELNQGFINSMFKIACGYGHLEIIQLLLCINPHINISHGSWIFLSLATTYGHLHVIKYLFENCVNSFDTEIIQDIKLDLAEIAEENGWNEITQYLNNQNELIDWTNEKNICLYDAVEYFNESNTNLFNFSCACLANKIVNTWGCKLTNINAFQTALYTLHYSPEQIKLLSTGLDWIPIANQFVFNAFKWNNNKMIQAAFNYGFIQSYPNPIELINIITQSKNTSLEIIKILLATHPKICISNESNSKLLIKSIYELNQNLCVGLSELIPDLYKLVNFNQFNDLKHICFFLANIPQTNSVDMFIQIINNIYVDKHLSDKEKIEKIEFLESIYPNAINQAIENIFDNNFNTKSFLFFLEIKTISNKIVEKNTFAHVLKLSNYVLTKFLFEYDPYIISSQITEVINQPDSIELVKRLIKIKDIKGINKNTYNIIIQYLIDCVITNHKLNIFDLLIFNSNVDYLFNYNYGKPSYLLNEKNVNFTYNYLNYKLDQVCSPICEITENIFKNIFKLCCYQEWYDSTKLINLKIINLILDNVKFNSEEICNGIVSLYKCNCYSYNLFMNIIFPIVEKLFVHVYEFLTEEDIYNMIIKILENCNHSKSCLIFTHIVEQTGFNIRYNNDALFKYARNKRLVSYFISFLIEKYSNFYRKCLNTYEIIDEIKEIYVNEINNCPICLDTKCNTITHCSHQFCSDCLYKYNNSACPICRREIESYYLIKLTV